MAAHLVIHWSAIALSIIVILSCNFPVTAATSDAQQRDIHYYVDPIPTYAKQFASDIVSEAAEAWEERNPNLKFHQTDSKQDADFFVQWVREYGTNHVGLAYIRFLQIGLGDSECKDRWQPFSRPIVKQIVIHEIGHFLGFGHSADKDNIMYPSIRETTYGEISDERPTRANRYHYVDFCGPVGVDSAFTYKVSTTHPKQGFDVYVVPSFESYEDAVRDKSFSYYSSEGCFGEGFLSFEGSCENVSASAGLVIINRQTDDLLETIQIKIYPAEHDYYYTIPIVNAEDLKKINQTAITAPTNLSYTHLGDNKIRFSWEAPTSFGYSAFDRYQVVQADAGNCCPIMVDYIKDTTIETTLPFDHWYAVVVSNEGGGWARSQALFISDNELDPQSSGSSSQSSGSSSQSPLGSQCLIATAAFGSEIAPQVQFLRDFRDQRILSTAAGSSFMNVFNAWYYSFSPQVADYEREQPWMQQTVRTVIYPLLGILTLSENTYSAIPGEFGALTAGLVASTLIGAVYVSPIVLSIKHVRKSRISYIHLLLAIATAITAVIISILSGNQLAMMVTTAGLVLTALISGALLFAKCLYNLGKKMQD